MAYRIKLMLYLRIWQALAKDRSGNILLIAGISIPILLFAIGFGIDYSQAQRARSQIGAIADSAVLSALSPQSVAITGISSSATSKLSSAVTTMFNSQTSNIPGLTIQTATVTPTFATDPNTGAQSVTISLQWTGTYKTIFGNILHVSALPINGLATGTYGTSVKRSYVNFIFLLDTSGSMEIAADDNSANIMGSQIGCLFACHAADYNATYSVAAAHARGATLRSDLLQNAANALMTKITTSSNAAIYYKVGIYDFNSVLTYDLAPTTNYTQVQSTISSLYSDSYLNSPGQTGNNYEDGTADNFASFVSQVSSGGDGSSASSPLVYVILITDGVVDPYTTYFPNFYNLSYSKFCPALKSKNVRLAAIWTPYTQDATFAYNLQTYNSWDVYYYNLAAAISANAQTSMVSCAYTSDLAFSATDSTSFNAAMAKIFASATAAATLPTLTQ